MYSFYMDFLILAFVLVYIYLKSLSVNAVVAHIGMRNWSEA